MEESKIKTEAELNAKRIFMSESSPQILTLKESLNYINGKIEVEKKKLTGAKNDTGINTITDEYKMLESDLELKMEAYKTALISYEKIKIDVARKLKQIILINTPKIPQYPVYPERFLNILYALIILLLAYGLLGLLKGIVKEHR